MLIDSRLYIGSGDFTGYIAKDGFNWSRNDLDGPNTGRALDGNLIRDRVATKIRLDITCRPLKSSEVRNLLNAIYPEFVTVRYDDPMQGYVSKTMYANNNKVKFGTKYTDGEEVWVDITFPLIER